MSQEMAVQARGLTKVYGTRLAVDQVDLNVTTGQVYGLLGPNGAGKTTLMKMLFGLVRPDLGEIRSFGRDATDVGVAALEGVAGFIEQPRFYGYLSARDNLRLLAGMDRLSRRQADQRIDLALEQVQLADRANDKVRGYSYGMGQRLGVASALIRQPRLLVVDEPTNGLDPSGIRDMRNLIRDLGETGMTVLLSSHNMLEVEELCDHVAVMNLGSIAYEGTIDQLREQAPQPDYRIVTTDNAAAVRVLADVQGVSNAAVLDGHVGFRSTSDGIDLITRRLADADIAIRTLEAGVTPLESLFFMLTEQNLAAAEQSRQEKAEVYA